MGTQARRASRDHRQHCPLCGRPVLVRNMSDHHVIPRSRGGQEKESICNACHQKIHATFTNKELEAEYNSVDKLLSDSQIAAFVKWLSKRDPDDTPQSHQSRDRRRKR